MTTLARMNPAGDTPLPDQPLIERIATSDGAHIAVKRKPRAGGTPVLFLHGLAVNADLWDLPTVPCGDIQYRSLASILHEAGYDVWLANFRGHGAPRMLSTPPPEQRDWCVDHFVLYDLPAVVYHVLEATGQRPFVIGASLGSMTLAAFLQGALLANDAVIADPGVAAERQAAIAGAILVEFPAALRWPRSTYRPDGALDWPVLLRDFWRTGGDCNFAFEILARLGWLEALVHTMGRVPLDWLRREPARASARRRPSRLADMLTHVQRSLVQAGLNLTGRFTGHSHYRAEVFIHGRRYVVDGMKAGVLKQLARSVRRGAFISGLGKPEHVYSDHYANIALPTLVVAGGRDRIASATVTREAFFDVIRSEDKTLHYYEDINHGEFEAAPIATQRVYPRILSWLNARRPLAAAAPAKSIG